MRLLLLFLLWSTAAIAQTDSTHLYKITYIVDVTDSDLAYESSQTNVLMTFGGGNHEVGGLAVSPDSSFYFKITYIVDGDTFDGRNIRTGEKIRFRPIGMDTPETGKRRGQDSEPYHRQATNYTWELLKDQIVRVEYDIDAQDRYGRDLVYVWLDDGRLFNEEILKAGWAVVATYPPNIKYVDRFTSGQREAREEGRGETCAQAVLDTRERYPDSSLADLYDPLTMPPDLVKAHQQLDRAVDRCYRPQPFTSERNRIEYLFQLYEEYTAPLLAAESKQKGKKTSKTKG